MNLSFFQEPELEFGNGGTHVDIRYGLSRFGPLDIGEPTAPVEIKVGLIGTDETIDQMRNWFDRCRKPVDAKPSKLTNLFPAFPGFSRDSPIGASLIFHDRWCSPIRQRELDGTLAQGSHIAREAASLFIDHAAGLVEAGGPMVLVCAPPKELLAAVDEPPTAKPDPLDQGIDEGSDPPHLARQPKIAFHDVLKAEGLRLGIPMQMVRPYTYTGEARSKPGKRAAVRSAPAQDEATRAWNIHTALYYKAAGVPWRLLRHPADLATCFVGISFYRSPDSDKVLTSVAQVFNERGEGVIVKGAQAQLSKDDRQPHLSEEDASSLLMSAVATYRREHRTNPARIVVHKSSRLTAGETTGFRSAADQHRIDTLELISLRRSFTRVFREGIYPPLRGTFIRLQDSTGLLYLRGSVQFFQTYPGMYVPRPIEMTVTQAETPVDRLAREVLALSKLNWNNTQFDGGEPITLRAARRVGDILKCIPAGGTMQPSFRFYI